MILAPDWDISSEDDSLMVAGLTEEILAVCGDSIQMSDEQVADLAHAVADYIRLECGDRLSDNGSLAMLASRALASLGARQAARRLVIHGTGLVRPSEWEVTGEEAVWVLDLRQITLRQEVQLELVFFQCLRFILDSLAEVWDSTGGAGILGLRHVSSTAKVILGGKKSPAEVETMGTEVKKAVRESLEQIRQARKWMTSPYVMDLDI